MQKFARKLMLAIKYWAQGDTWKEAWGWATDLVDWKQDNGL